jgi:hypothetical protein
MKKIKKGASEDLKKILMPLVIERYDEITSKNPELKWHCFPFDNKDPFDILKVVTAMEEHIKLKKVKPL